MRVGDNVLINTAHVVQKKFGAAIAGSELFERRRLPGRSLPDEACSRALFSRSDPTK